MSLLLIVLLAIVQGLTEFLPVSSSGHLVVSRAILGPTLGTISSPLAFDILIHFATALVTAFFLRKELLVILRKVFTATGERERRLVGLLIVATLPAVVIGLSFKDTIESLFISPHWALNGFLVTAILLELAHRFQVKLGADSAAALTTLIIGVGQACAIMPGISRSGSTIAIALLLSLPARTAVLFSFFMLLPVIAGACLLEAKELASLESIDSTPLLIAFFTTMATAYVALRFLVWIVEGAKLRWFAIYTFAISCGLRFFI
ncbi:UNVERIFIED_CONTAM: hypothetical protein GTU68_029013 [Idotea baltica]|nr:hypothetical protein [Idotea baltica]